MTYQTDGIYQSSLLSQHAGLIHGFSSRIYADARVSANMDRILARLGATAFHVVGVKQVHGDRVVIADRSSGRLAQEADAIVSVQPDILLEIHVADCVPVLLYDPVSRIAGAVHAGWRGTQKQIVRRAVDAMVEHGADAARILAAIGPHIGPCCYAVPEDRAGLFGPDAEVRDAAWYVDLGAANKRQLISAGVDRDRIDVVTDCTSCRTDVFFSYRKDTKETFGEIVGVIGVK